MAGINAALKIKGEPPLILNRSDGYTAILIDDLISKGTNEPYRMFTSRAEFRLHLRIDNADLRLTPLGRRVGLINDEAWANYEAKQERLKAIKAFLERTRPTREMLEALSSTVKADSQAMIDLQPAIGQTLAQLLKRPEIKIEFFVPILRGLAPELLTQSDSAAWLRTDLKSVETEIKYAGYLDQQHKAIERLKKAEQRAIPTWFDYRSVSGLSREMQEKLTHIRPRTLAQASGIPGVTPAAVALVNVFIQIQARQQPA